MQHLSSVSQICHRISCWLDMLTSVHMDTGPLNVVAAFFKTKNCLDLSSFLIILVHDPQLMANGA